MSYAKVIIQTAFTKEIIKVETSPSHMASTKDTKLQVVIKMVKFFVDIVPAFGIRDRKELHQSFRLVKLRTAAFLEKIETKLVKGSGCQQRSTGRRKRCVLT